MNNENEIFHPPQLIDLKEPELQTNIKDGLDLNNQRIKDIDTLNFTLRNAIQNYVDNEDGYLETIKKEADSLVNISKGLKNVLDEDKIPQTSDQQFLILQADTKKLQEQLKSINADFLQQENEKKQLTIQLEKAQEGIQPTVLSKIELPNSDNQLGIIFNWFAGCILKKKNNAIELAKELQLDVEKYQPQPQSIINEPLPPQQSNIFACGGNKKIPAISRPLKRILPPEEEMRYYEVYNSWKAIKKYIFSEKFQLQQKLQDFAKEYQHLQPFQIMLIDELISEKKNILKGIFEIDIKDQVRMLIEINEVIFKFHNYESEKANENKKIDEFTEIENEYNQKQHVLSILTSQKQFTQNRQKRLDDLKKKVDSMLEDAKNMFNESIQNIENNNKLIQNIEAEKTQLYSKQFEQVNQIENQYTENQLKKITEEQQDQNKELNLEVQEPNSNQVPSHSQLEQDSQQQDQENEDDPYYNNDYSSDNDDSEKGEHDYMPLSQDQNLKQIQLTLFPDKVKTETNKQTAKEKKQQESLLSLMVKKRKK